MAYIEPKIGDEIICIDDDSQDEDFGMSGIVLEGTRGLVVGRAYKIETLDFSQVPENKIEYGSPIWAEKEYDRVRWYWIRAWITGKGFSGLMFLGKFKRS